jgi:hypothetical protein
VWQVLPDSTLESLPVRIIYGAPPHSYLTVAGPAKLRHGRYCLDISGVTVLTFSIDARGYALAGE